MRYEYFEEDERISECFYCPICSEIFDNPIILQCGHSFCHKCCEHAINSKFTNCAVCRFEIEMPPRMIKNITLNNIISELLVHCIEKEKGCDWIGKRDNLRNHHTSDCKLNKQARKKWICAFCNCKRKKNLKTNNNNQYFFTLS